MNIHTKETLGFWPLYRNGALTAVVYGTSEAAANLLALLLPPDATLGTEPARSPSGPFAPTSGFGLTVKGLT